MQIKNTTIPSSIFFPSGVLISAKGERIVSVIAFLFGSLMGAIFFIAGLFDKSVSWWDLVAAFVATVAGLVSAYGMARSKPWGFYVGAGCLIVVPIIAVTFDESDRSLNGLTGTLWLIIWASALVRLANRLASLPTPAGALIDQIAAHHQLDWSSHVLTQVDELVRSGKTAEATRLFHSEAGVTWDEANAAIGNWSANVVERKLFFLAKHIRECSIHEVEATVCRTL